MSFYCLPANREPLTSLELCTAAAPIGNRFVVKSTISQTLVLVHVNRNVLHEVLTFFDDHFLATAKTLFFLSFSNSKQTKTIRQINLTATVIWAAVGDK